MGVGKELIGNSAYRNHVTAEKDSVSLDEKKITASSTAGSTSCSATRFSSPEKPLCGAILSFLFLRAYFRASRCIVDLLSPRTENIDRILDVNVSSV